MEGVQKLKCSSCGITFMSENNSPLCPTCSENSSSHHHGEEHGCGCGGHWLLFLKWIIYLVLFEVSSLFHSNSDFADSNDWSYSINCTTILYMKLECLFCINGYYKKYQMTKCCDPSNCLD